MGIIILILLIIVVISILLGVEIKSTNTSKAVVFVAVCWLVLIPSLLLIFLDMSIATPIKSNTPISPTIQVEQTIENGLITSDTTYIYKIK